MEPQRFMSTMFVDALRACFKDAGYAQKEKEKEEHDGRLLVAYQSHLFAVYGNYAVLEASTGFNAIGVGEDYAKGVLFATTAATLTVEARVLLALQAAEALSAGVRSPFTIEVLEPHVAPSANEAAEDLSALALTPQQGQAKARRLVLHEHTSARAHELAPVRSPTRHDGKGVRTGAETGVQTGTMGTTGTHDQETEKERVSAVRPIVLSVPSESSSFENALGPPMKARRRAKETVLPGAHGEVHRRRVRHDDRGGGLLGH